MINDTPRQPKMINGVTRQQRSIYRILGQIFVFK